MGAGTNRQFINIVVGLIGIVAFSIYIYAIVIMGQTSLSHPNFTEARDFRGRVIQDDEGEPVIVPNTPPVISEIAKIIHTTISAALALNFGSVIGIQVTRAGTNPATGQTLSPQPQSLLDSPVTPVVEEPKTQLNMATESVVGFFSGGKNIFLKFLALDMRYWAVIIYLLGLGIGFAYFILDGGFKADPGTVAPDLKDIVFETIGIAGGVVNSFRKAS